MPFHLVSRFDRSSIGKAVPGDSGVLLLHDDVRTGDLFRFLVDRLIAHGRQFALPSVARPTN